MQIFLTKMRVLIMTLALAGAAGCANDHPSYRSSVKVTDVAHTAVKRQSIGNCWLYGEATWLESLLKTYRHEDLNISESYWTWWHWYDQLTQADFRDTKIQTGGSWFEAARLIQQHGWVLSGEFIPADATSEMSLKQRDALNRVNQELTAGGRIATPAKRTPAAVRRVLDEAFGSDMATTERLARPASTTLIGRDSNGTISLEDALFDSAGRGWQFVDFPEDDEGRREMLIRVFRALNDYQPVMMDILVDFNALDMNDNGAFKKGILDAAGKPGTQGGHVVVLKDYEVDHVPGYGFLGRGDFSAAKKTAALQGNLVSLVAKNSWGAHRHDRGMIDGYTAFYEDYLYGPIAWKGEEDSRGPGIMIAPLQAFVLPPNY